jgi:hypothetical protein
MNVTALAVIVDNLVAICRNKIFIKGFLNFLSVTTRTHPNQEQN